MSTENATDLFYFANQVYQFSYAKPIYDRLGGTVIVPTHTKYLRFKRHLRNVSSFPEVRTFLRTPPILLVRNPRQLPMSRGVIVSQAIRRMISAKGYCHTIFMGHGTGDRKYGGNLDNLPLFDYHFISGPKHVQKLKDSDVSIPAQQLIKIGNPRFDAIVNRTIDRDRAMDTLGIVDRQRPNILFAPTWKKGRGTLSQYGYRFCQELTKQFNLIIRPHYYEQGTAHRLRIWAALRRIKHVYFSNASDLLGRDTMIDFEISDLLISDTSSIHYEYLITGKPIIIAYSEPVKLHEMPESMDVRSVATAYDGRSDIARLVEQTLAAHRSREYTELLNACFYFNDGKSTDRAVAFIQSLLAGAAPGGSKVSSSC